MGIVRSIQKGEHPASKFSKSAQDAAKKMKKKFKGNVKGDWVDVVVPGLEWMSKLGESAQRDYKAEYKNFNHQQRLRSTEPS